MDLLPRHVLPQVDVESLAIKLPWTTSPAGPLEALSGLQTTLEVVVWVIRHRFDLTVNCETG